MAKLFIISTPIGNLGDISLRALEILKSSVNTVFCEDTRITSKLLNHFDIQDVKLLSFNKESEAKKVQLVIEKLNSGDDLGLISDAGTPLISDPGSLLVQEIYKTDHELVTIPGASSLAAALSVCPIDTSRFVFEGFLPHGPKQRRRVLRELIEEKRPLVFFESPHRVLKSLQDILDILGENREVFIARELTKKFEQLYFGKISDVLQALKEQFIDGKVQGEFVLVIGLATGP